MGNSAPPNRACWRAPARPLFRRAATSLVPPPRIARGALTIVAGTARPRSAGEAATPSSSPIVAADVVEKTSEVVALPPAPVRTSSADSSSTTMRQQRPGSAPPAPSLQRAPRAEVAAGIGRRQHHQNHQRTARPPSPSVDRALAAGAPADEAGSSLWSAPDELFQRATGRSDCFPVGWVERGVDLPPAPVRSSSAATSASTSSSSSARHQRSRPLFPELHGSRLIVVDRHPFRGDAPLLIPVTARGVATASILGAGMLVAAVASAAAVVNKGRRRKQRDPAAAAAAAPAATDGERDAGSSSADADALLRRRGEAAAARLRLRFAGALDGGDQSGGGSLGRDDEGEDEESDASRRKREKEAARAFRSFFSKAKMHLVDEDAWSKEEKKN